ncbi:hypothetical protein N7468_000830 [Penicillium chermesinum]|uniref:GPI anchored serine-threonine rich protein n=1 Tax=Penicillium chermesinum TaxID=63820 RepID=A0A9W9PIG4_9EURO|nr:uncharacterized protein N7468_000830 [Penicillium chermesinum]KAJ5245847.1 hypothetical protein N7468_000830 [Penicillium chermesinum]
MKLSLIALSAALAVAAADTTSTTEPTATVTLSPEAQCATHCDRNDTCCIAKCYHVPCPNATQANDTNSCVRACPQGTGSPEDTKKFADCEQSCYSSHFFPADGATAQATSTTVTHNGVTTTETSFAQSTSSSNGDSTQSSGTATSTGAIQTENAAANIRLGASGAGLFGLVLAALAL